MKILAKSQPTSYKNIKVHFDNMNESTLREWYPDEMKFYDKLISLLPSVLRDINDQGKDLKALVDVWYASNGGVTIDVVVYGFDIEDSFDPYLTVLDESVDTQFLAKLDECTNAYFVSLMDAKHLFGYITIKTGPYMFFRYAF